MVELQKYIDNFIQITGKMYFQKIIHTHFMLLQVSPLWLLNTG